ncbi:MAG: hypothetical protein IT175_12200 [Acidobacteria bacterium]|nr:hypothetical protein [Acidobacteriota bacterium]
MTDGPWYITRKAVEDYLAILGRRETGESFAIAERELIALARVVTAPDREAVPGRTDAGLLRYRGPRPLRLQLLVSAAPHEHGELPQLVAVLPQTRSGR